MEVGGYGNMVQEMVLSTNDCYILSLNKGSAA